MAERAPAKRTSRVVILPSIEAHHMEILLASATILQFLVLLVHLSEANGAVSVILEIDVLGVLSRRVQSRLQAFSQLLVQDFISSLGDLGNRTPEIIQKFLILSHLSDDEEDMLAWFFLHFEVEALT